MTKKQRQTRRMAAPRMTDAQRRQQRAARLLAELEQCGYAVTRLGGWQYFIQPKAGAA